MLQAVEQSRVNRLHYASLPTPSNASSSSLSSSASTSSSPASSPSSSAASSPSPLSSSSSTLHPLRSFAMTIPNRHHIIIVTGPAGCGKSTVAKYLADRYAFRYIEGDEYHPQANIDKMAAGTPLNDEDRWDWLISLRDQALQDLKQDARGVVVTCSALKKKYRDVIRTARLYDEDPNANVHFVYLRADKETLLARVRARKGHYMKDAMVESQFAALEEPDEAECKLLKDVEVVDVTGSPQEVQNLATMAVDRVLATACRSSR